MKTLYRFFCILFLCFGTLLTNAQDIKNYNGNYVGTAHTIMVSGNQKPAQKMTFKLQNGVLTGNVPKLGKMPGTINFVIKNVTIDSNGELKTTSKDAGAIKMLGIFSPTLNWDKKGDNKADHFSGSIKTINGVKTLQLQLKVYSSVMGVKRIPAIVGFKGTLAP